MRHPILFSCALLLGACADANPAPIAVTPDAGPSGLAVLGAGSHEPSGLDVVEIATAAHELFEPRDLAFSPVADHQLWIINRDSGMVIVSATGTAEQTTVWRRSPGYEHFLWLPSSLAFGDATMATAHDTNDVTQPSTPSDFMGPSLWPIDPAAYTGGHASHLDMLHNSPNAAGIAWDSGNAFWIFDGFHSSITFYDFRADHGPGGEDHGDGLIHRWVEGQVRYVAGVSSHMELDRAAGVLYVADTGNVRVAVLDVHSGTPGGLLSPDYDGAEMRSVESLPLSTLVDGSAFGMVQPSGLALRDGVLFVTDRALSIVHAFDTSGMQLDWLDLSSAIAPGSLGAVELDAEGRLYVTDIGGHRVLRIAPRAR